ncbi:hypothetical protein BpHYR1_021561, partial [Brachionus plicatilis]
KLKKNFELKKCLTLKLTLLGKVNPIVVLLKEWTLKKLLDKDGKLKFEIQIKRSKYKLEKINFSKSIT